MKLNNLFKLCAILFCSAAIFTGCQQEENEMPIALEVQSQLTFPAVGAEVQYLTVAAGSDESWVLDYAEDWLMLEPTSGTGPVEVKVTVEDNVDANNVIQKDRKAVVTVVPTRSDNEKYIKKATIHQKGDTFLGAPEYTVSELVALQNTEEEDMIPVKAKSSKVVAVADEGFVVTDGTENILVSGAAEVVPGNNVTFSGHKVTLPGSLPALVLGEVITNDNATEVTYPETNDITSSLDSYTSTKAEYITVSGTLVQNSIMNIAGASKSVNVYEAEMLSEYNIHKVTISGYYAGVVNGSPSMVVANVKSNGEDNEFGEAFPFNDDFSWLAPFIEQSNAVLAADKQISDCVGEVTSSSDGCANIYTTLVKANIPVLQTLRQRGYVDLNPDMETIYLQDAYLKFGKTDCQSGLRLPFLKIEGTQDIAVSFKWCAQMQSSGKIDKTKLVVAITGPGTIEGASKSKVPGQFVSPAIEHTQQTDQMFWQDAMVFINGATRATSITIRPCDDHFGSSDAVVKSTLRFYMDDISVVNAADAVESKITVEGLENNLITFEGDPAGPVSFNVKSDKDYKIQTSAKWFSVDVTEGFGGETKTVNVTCEPSTLSTLRQGSVIVKSGTSTHTISVVQSAAGQELDPYIALSTGNNITVLGEGEEFSAKVQTNTTYEVEASDWIEVVETPVTKAKTEWFEHKFIAKVNMTGAKRTGYVRFANKDLGIESVLNVEQENFVPRIDVIPAMPFRALSGKGGSMTFALDANIPYSVSTDASWITLPANQGPSGQIAVPIAFGANDAAAERTANIIFTNPTYEYTKTLEVIQSPAGIILQDDFDWVKPFNEAGGNTAGDTIGSGGSSSGAPNVYTASGYGEAFLKAFAAMGYVDLCPGEKVLYAQDAYLKFGRTQGHNNALEINVPFMKTTDATIDFDFAAMVQGGGTVDDSDLTLVIVGEGTFENGTKYSDELKIVQEKGAYNWTHASAKILGANENTKIRIVMTRILGKSSDGTFDGTYNYNVSGAGRWFLDNLVIK